MSRQNRNYDKEFKLNAVQLCKNSGKPGSKIADDLGIPKQTLYQWIKDYKADGEEGFRGKGNIRLAMKKCFFLKKNQLSEVAYIVHTLKEVNAICR